MPLNPNPNNFHTLYFPFSPRQNNKSNRMGSTCCHITDDQKFLEIEESKRERIRINADLATEDQISFRSFSVYSIGKPSQDDTIKSLARRLLAIRYFSLSSLITSLNLPCRALYGAYVTPIEIQMIEDRIPPMALPSDTDDLSLVPLPHVELPEGEVYKGYWSPDTKLPEFFGTIIHLNYSKYTGHVKAGKCSGQGRLIKIDGEVYEGEFANGLPDGLGVLSKSNGLVHKGMFRQGKEHGEGLIEYEGEVIYSGGFVDGAKHGFGSLKISEGNSYAGEFLNNCMEGKGKYVWDDGKVYEGSWKANKIHGEGKYSWPDGRVYEGCYNDGNRDGYGIFKWPDGREYRGEWNLGSMNGVGSYTFLDKNGFTKTVKALWENGKKKKVLKN